MSEEPVEVQAEVESISSDQVPSDNPAFKDLDFALLAIFRSYRSQRIAAVIVVSVGIFLLFTFILAAVGLVLLLVGCILYLYNVGNIVQHFSLVKKYRVALAQAGVASTPVFDRAVKAKSTASLALFVASLPGGFVIAYIFVSFLHTWSGR
jgi:hypothetical protein